MIVGLCGKKGAGKDAAGDYLVKEHGFTRLSFADPLKSSAARCWEGVELDDWNTWKNDPNVVVEIRRLHEFSEDDQILASESAREFLQRYGTEAHREVFGTNFWVEHLEFQLDEAPNNENFVVTDARFENEMLVLKKYGALMVYLDRPGLDNEDQHASEQSTVMNLIDVVLPNDGTLGDLWTRMDLLAAGAVIPSSL